VTIGAISAPISFSGLAPGFVGLYQVNAQVPANASTGNAVPAVVSIGGVTSNSVTIAVEGPPTPASPPDFTITKATGPNPAQGRVDAVL
jgi:hypothetical protein